MRIADVPGRKRSATAHSNPDVSALEERIGHAFRNQALLTEALTHPSVGHELQNHQFDNQRLEFLGDAVLQLVVTEHLFTQFPREAEGQLTKLRSRLVSRDALKRHAQRVKLGSFLRLGRGEEASGGRERSSTLADAFEALIGAIYLDSDLGTARGFILREAADELARVVAEPVDVNPKGQLQEILQAISPASPVYEIVSQSGPEHAKQFVVRAVWDGIDLGEGAGRSKKEAETAAATAAIEAKRWKKR